ncbi:MAG: bifunctional 4-hydroxy-2-oxoglutarate aldolase/2-dehydro-3-deoxy-phosphogluconate aldolase [Planctomycetes bacterium]|nr:bifunctional 4-hydroxy-2-oxoglutarate aldolase/2-dehydro-3-deoxy-phosphogluconate aldolase [Planctomycetota bacterium]
MSVKNTVETLLRDGFILVFNQDKLDIAKTAEAAMQAGVNNMEVTCRIKKPVEKIQLLRKEFPDFTIGVASLIDFPKMLEVYNRHHANDPLPTVEQVIDAGAGYIVSAGSFSDDTYQKFGDKVAIIPGCGTVTEIINQFSKGANLCKIFPAKQLGGPAFVKAIDAPLHKIISIVPTGGTNVTNIPDYIDAGILVVGASFSLIEKQTMQKIVDQQDYKLLADQLKKIKQLIDTTRAEKWPNIDFAAASVDQIAKITGRNFNIS